MVLLAAAVPMVTYGALIADVNGDEVPDMVAYSKAGVTAAAVLDYRQAVASIYPSMDAL